MMIRRMEERDLPHVAAIDKSLFGDPWSEEAFRASLKQPEAHFLAAEDEQAGVVGYCGSYRALDEAEIVNVAVSSDYQNHGTGRLLVGQLMKEETAAGVQNFILEVRLGNLAAQHVYEMLGFRRIGIRKHFYDNPVEDAVIMQKVNITDDE